MEVMGGGTGFVVLRRGVAAMERLLITRALLKQRFPESGTGE